ncbi:cytochrome P450 [Sistotremastrum niveocremeum HHB9708]|uniref:Cytochrome P450 n=1 Tax=Sistotremastrum niveocremeum HHB9708 TaxID=1314777 RepID=A0A164Y6C7_9AGAM|nr:cytochrome P450 [Sistotremastrum niveocremeum HHB9708]
MSLMFHVLFSASTFLAFICLVAFYHIWFRPRFSPLLSLPGPKSPSFIWGNLGEILVSGPGELHARWLQQFGAVLTYKGFLNTNRLFTHDTRVIAHVLSHPDDFPKPPEVRSALARILGRGLLSSEGHDHRKQRKILNVAFSSQNIRDFTELFFESALELRDTWLDMISDSTDSSDSVKLDALDWLARVTLDVIGIAGFGYRFNAVRSPDDGKDAMAAAFFLGAESGRPMPILRSLIPILRIWPSERERRVQNSLKILRDIGRRLITAKKDALHKSAEGGKLDKQSFQGRDVLTLLLRANMSSNVPHGARLSDEEVLCQVPTFMVAGHETTSSATSWCLYSLATNPEVQRKLREELCRVETDRPSIDVLNSLHYLDWVLRETLRLHAHVPSSMRIAVKDTVIPFGAPVTDRNGTEISEVRVQRGDGINIPIITLNRSTEFWGEDAMQFRPERWADLPEAVMNIPGVWGGLMTFLGGSRSCIGYKFAIAEMKALIFTMVRTFAFEMADADIEIVKRSGIVTRPFVKSQLEKGNQMPLKVSILRE